MPKDSNKTTRHRIDVSQDVNGLCISARNYHGIRWDSAIAMPFIAAAAYYAFLYFLLPHVIYQFPQIQSVAPYAAPMKHLIPVFLIAAFYLVDMTNLYHLFGRPAIAGSIGYYSWQVKVTPGIVEVTRKWLLRTSRKRIPFSALRSYSVAPIFEFCTSQGTVTVDMDIHGSHGSKISKLLADALPGVPIEGRG